MPTDWGLILPKFLAKFVKIKNKNSVAKIWEVIDLHITLICNSLFLRLLSGCEFGVTVCF